MELPRHARRSRHHWFPATGNPKSRRRVFHPGNCGPIDAQVVGRGCIEDSGLCRREKDATRLNYVRQLLLDQ